MDTEKVRVLLLALQKGNMTEAAAETGYTLSGVSRMMQALEEETGCRLLYRSKNGVLPTPDCETLLPVMRRLVETAEHYRQKAAQIRGLLTGTVRIGTAYSPFYPVISGTIADFAARYPDIRVEIREEFSSILAAQVAHHEMDLAIISRRDGPFDWHELFLDRMVAWVPDQYPLEGTVYPLRLFETDPFIDIFPGDQSDNARAFRENHIEPNTRYSALMTMSAFSMVEAGLGVTMTNGILRDLWHGAVRVMRTEPEILVPIGLISQPKEYLSPAAEKFLACFLPRLKEAGAMLQKQETTQAMHDMIGQR